jgi:hypothetical protein
MLRPRNADNSSPVVSRRSAWESLRSSQPSLCSVQREFLILRLCTPSMLMPVMLGFLVKKTPSWSAIASATAGLVVVLITNVFIDVTPYQYEVNIFGGVGVASLVFFLSMLFKETDAQAPGRQDRFAEDLSRPANAEGIGWGTNALSSYRIVGLLTAAIGITVIGLALVPTTSQVRFLTLALGLGTAGLGGLMVWFFHRETAKQKVKTMHKGDAP